MEVPVNQRSRRTEHTKYGVVNWVFRGLRDTFAVRWMQKRALHYEIDKGDDPIFKRLGSNLDIWFFLLGLPA